MEEEVAWHSKAPGGHFSGGRVERRKGRGRREEESTAPFWRENWIWAIWAEKQPLVGRAIGSLYTDHGGEEDGDDAAKEGGVLGDL